MSFFKQDYLDFFMELAPNNNKDWFDANRKRYEQNVKKPFQDFVSHLIQKISVKYPEFKELEAKDCLFRINRDIRFSKDKAPYKLMMSAVVAPGGKKSRAINGVYFELTPEHVRIYGGVYEVEKEDMLLIREGIAAKPTEFKKLYTDKAFTKLFGQIQGEKNKTLPKELKEAADLEPLIYNKQWYFYTELPAESILDPKLDQIIVDSFEVCLPLEQFFNNLIKR